MIFFMGFIVGILASLFALMIVVTLSGRD